ncbi:acetate--CoA ligase family protein [Nocardioides pacificus]
MTETRTPDATTRDAITPERLTSLFRPRSVAMVGASDKSNFSRGTYANLVRFGYADRTFLVNRRGVETHGRPTYTSCAEIGQPVDLAYVMVPQAGTLEALTDAAGAGVRNAVVLSSGWGEVGEAGKAAQDELVAHADSLGITLLGPNLIGFINFVDGVPVKAGPAPLQAAGPVAMMSQSGLISAAMQDYASMTGVGLSYEVTLGNEAMVTAGHVLDFLVADETTRAIAMFLETIREPESFRAAALRAAEAGKAIVMLKAGRSELAARTAAAHTGALVGDDKVIDAVLRDLGVIRVDTIEDLITTAGATAALGPLSSPGIGVVSLSGGACDIIADLVEDAESMLPALAPETEAEMAVFFSELGTVQNPLDITGAAVIKTELFTQAITTMSQDPSIGAVAAVLGMPWHADGQGAWRGMAMAKAIGEGMAAAHCPTLWVNQVTQPNTDYTRELMAEAGVPYVLPGIQAGVTALSGLSRWSQRRGELAEARAVPAQDVAVPVPLASERTGKWSEAAARGLLEAAGIPVVPARLVTSPETAVAAAAALGGPVAMKVASPDILHKSDIGGVRLAVSGESAVREAYDAVVRAAEQVPDAKVEGVLVSPMRGPAPELLVGVVRDEQWGPILAVAIGGVLVEVLDDSVLTTLPVTPKRARTLLESLRAAAVLHGVRGGPAADLDALAAVIARVGDLALALGDDLVSLEVNPLRVHGTQVEALDAVVEWRNA